jgi:cell division protein FtsQ
MHATATLQHSAAPSGRVLRRRPAAAAPAVVPVPPGARLLRGAAAASALLLALSLLGAGAVALTRTPVFTLSHIELHGDQQRHSAEELRAHAMPRLGGNFFSLDLRQAQAVFQDLPWVRRAEVRRVWPDALWVRLEEHVPAALWEGSDEAGSAAGLERLVNTHGELFDANPGEVEDEALPVFTGAGDSAVDALALYGRLQPAFAGMGVAVQRLERSSRGAWRARLDSGARIELGRGSNDELAARAERLARTLPAALQRLDPPLAVAAVEVADLRHAEGYALRLAGVGTLPAAASASTAPRATAPRQPAAAARAPRAGRPPTQQR